ncbi:tRNA (adenine-N1)-methyltransferase [Acidilobus sp. SCGC AC-742_E15]|nr:tRNA (adenine-N1)-methyltransferase [Acidilobus sp. SCGC AC-742_E15]
MSIAEGDWVLLLVEGRERRKTYVFRAREKASYSTFAGAVRGSQLVGAAWGSRLELERGTAYLLRPTLYDMMMHVYPRRSQVVYPKDAGYMTSLAGLMPGMRVLEAGAGSGFLTIWIAAHVCPGGFVFTYEVRDDMIEVASANVKAAGLEGCVKIKKGDVRAGVEEGDLDAAFLDMPDPWEALPSVRKALKPSAPLVVFVPTVNQVIKLLDAVFRLGGFVVQEVSEVIKREWEARADALRPSVRMIGHTGIIVLLRSLAS